MASRSPHRKIERTPEERAALQADRERLQRERPGLDELLSSGEYDGPYPHADVAALLELLAEMREVRIRAGLTLDQVSDRSGLDKGTLSRLENGKLLNPTLQTLWKYAAALGLRLLLGQQPAA